MRGNGFVPRSPAAEGRFKEFLKMLGAAGPGTTAKESENASPISKEKREYRH